MVRAMNAYPKEMIDAFEVLDENYKVRGERDKRAKALRKDGFTVTVETVNFSGFGYGKAYFLHARRPRVDGELGGVQNG